MPDRSKRYGAAAKAALAALLVAACSGVNPAKDDEFVATQKLLNEARANPTVAEYAEVPLKDAADTLARAREADTLPDLRHLTYVARKKVEIANLIAMMRATEARLEKAQKAERDLGARRPEDAEAGGIAQSTALVEQIPLAEPVMSGTISAALAPAETAPPGQGTAAPDGPSETTERVDAAAAEAVSSAAKSEAVAALSLAAYLPGFNLTQQAQGIVITLPPSSFSSGETKLNDGVREQLEPLVQFLKDNPRRTVVVKGHADNRGDPAWNIKVSNRRAESVRDALVDQGISVTRILTIGYGDNNPIASNDTEEGRRANRRVEIVLVSDVERARNISSAPADRPQSPEDEEQPPAAEPATKPAPPSGGPDDPAGRSGPGREQQGGAPRAVSPAAAKTATDAPAAKPAVLIRVGDEGAPSADGPPMSITR